MTALACWIEKNVIHGNGIFTPPNVWAVADSRISEDVIRTHTGEKEYSTLHDHAAKIFSIPITIKSAEGHGRFTRVVFQNSIGLAYSGSSLTGTSVSLATASLLDSLNVVDGAARPRLSDIASLVARLLRDYIRALGLARSERAIAECAVMGFCPRTNEAQIFELHPMIGEEVQVTPEVVDTSGKGAYLLLGDRKDRIKELIGTERMALPPETASWWRAPARIIQRCIDDEEFPTIGGTMQVCIGDSRGFKPHWVLHRGPGNEAVLAYLGLSIVQEQLRVGPCLIGMEGMDMGLT